MKDIITKIEAYELLDIESIKSVESVESIESIESIVNQARSTLSNISLAFGKITNRIIWSRKMILLSYNNDITINLIQKNVNKNANRVISIYVTSDKYYCPINRNIIIYVPAGYDINKIRDLPNTLNNVHD